VDGGEGEEMPSEKRIVKDTGTGEVTLRTVLFRDDGEWFATVGDEPISAELFEAMQKPVIEMRLVDDDAD
jgi:hypothetical protein